MRHWHRRIVAAIILALVMAGFPAFSASALAPQHFAFQRTWERTDLNPSVRPYQTWIWGPGGFSAAMWEFYDESPDGRRLVQYFDKSRMEITNPAGDPNSVWYVTNGLLVKELITGQMQMGDNRFVQVAPAGVNVAGDPNDPAGPTYSTFTSMLTLPPLEGGAPVIQRVSRAGAVTDDPSLAQYGVSAAELVDVPGIRHRVASPFWEFMTASGQVYENGAYVTAPLFENPYYATGYPITEAYWANVIVAGTQRDVLMQCFERRCLTYTPDNAPEWRVEMGNVGQHYYIWRHLAAIPVEPPAIEIGEYDVLNPAPLIEWPFPQGGDAFVIMQNDSPFPMQVTFDGPASQTITIPANPDAIVYPNDAAYPGCDPDGPFDQLILPAGNYRVKLDFIGGNVAAGRAHWTLIPDAYYSGCYFVVSQNPPDPLPDPTTPAVGIVEITHIEHDSPIPDETSGEYVVLRNVDLHPIQMLGWRIVDLQGNTYTFPSFILESGASVTVHNCAGQNDAANLYSGACEAMWNNGGDTATLFNALGNVVDVYSY